MIPIDQTIIDHNPEKGIKGDCLRACIASLFELSIEQVPHFVSYPDDQWRGVFLDFIYEQGYIYEGFAPESELNNPDKIQGVDGYIIVTGISPRQLNHAVIYKGGKLFHDPHPSKLGLVSVKGFHIIKRNNSNFRQNPWRLFC